MTRRNPRRRTRDKKAGKYSRSVSRHSSGDLFLNVSITLIAIVVVGLGYSWVDRHFLSDPDTGFASIKTINEPTTLTSKMWMEKPFKNIQVEVLNGCGVDGIARDATNYLRDKGFDVVRTENADHQDYENTIIKDRAGNLSVARKVAAAFEMDTLTVAQEVNHSLMLDVSVILGKDYMEHPPFNKTAEPLP